MSEMTRRRNNIPNRKKKPTQENYYYLWPNLPSQLKNSIAREPNHLMQNITSFGGVTKSWRAASRSCNSSLPKLIEINRKTSWDYLEDERSHIFDIPHHNEYPWPFFHRKRDYTGPHGEVFPLPENFSWRSICSYCPGGYFKGCSHGEVFVLSTDFPSSFYLWNTSRSSWCLPSWDLKLPIKLATTSSKSSDGCSCNLMVLTGIPSPAFAFFRLHKDPHVWITENCNIKESYGEGDMQFCNAIGFKGKFYVLSLQGSLVVIEDIIDSSFGITGVSRNRAIPSKKSRQFREFLVELNEEILLVFLISRKSIDFVDDIEVFKLDALKLLWIKVESLGEGTLFLEDQCCMGVNARKLGWRKNSIYFTHDRINEWWVFDMERGIMLPFSSLTSTWESE